MSHHKEHEKRDSRAEETPEPPLGNGDPDAPLAEPELPTERVIVYGDASATYGSMVAPEVIRPHEGKLDDVLTPLRKKQEKERGKTLVEVFSKEKEEEEEHKHKKGHK